MTRKKLMISLLLAWVTGTAIAVEAPLPDKKEEAVTTAQLMANKKAIVAKNLPMTPDQEKIFWPLYDDYQIQLNKLNADRMAMVTKYAVNYNLMDDKLTQQLLDTALKIEKRRYDLKKELVSKFSRELPVKLVARYFQLENKIDALVMSESVQQVPLIH